MTEPKKVKSGRNISGRVYPSTKVRSAHSRTKRKSRWTPREIKQLSADFRSGKLRRPFYLRETHGKAATDVLGKVTDIRYNKLDKWMWADMHVDSDAAVAAIKSGDYRGFSFCYGLGVAHKRAIEISLTPTGSEDFVGAEIIEQHSHDQATRDTFLLSWPLRNGPLPNPTASMSDAAPQNAGAPEAAAAGEPLGHSYEELGLVQGTDGTYFSMDAETVAAAKKRALSLGLDPSRITQKSVQDVTPDLIARFHEGSEETQNALLTAMMASAADGEAAARKHQQLQKKVAKERAAAAAADAAACRAKLAPLAKQLTAEYAGEGYTEEALQKVQEEMVDRLSTKEGKLWGTILAKQMERSAEMQRSLDKAQRQLEREATKKKSAQAATQAGLFRNEQVMAHSARGGSFNDVLSNFFLGRTGARPEPAASTLGKRRQRATAHDDDDDEVVVKHSRYNAAPAPARCPHATPSGFSVYPALSAGGVPGFCAAGRAHVGAGNLVEVVVAHSASAEREASKLTKKDNSHLNNEEVRAAMVTGLVTRAALTSSQFRSTEITNSLMTGYPEMFNQLIYESYVKPTEVATNQNSGVYGTDTLEANRSLQGPEQPVWVSQHVAGASRDLSKYRVEQADFGKVHA